MWIASLETLRADGGRRIVDLVKVTTDDGFASWSEQTRRSADPVSRR